LPMDKDDYEYTCDEPISLGILTLRQGFDF